MKKWSVIIGVLGITVCLTIVGIFSVLAQGESEVTIPTKISYQGYLEDSTGPLNQTDVSMTFSLYATAVGGSPLWSEIQSVNVNDGLFNVLLGSGSPMDSNDFDSDRYLGISVNSDPEMSPRQQLVSVASGDWTRVKPFALGPCFGACYETSIRSATGKVSRTGNGPVCVSTSVRSLVVPDVVG